MGKKGTAYERELKGILSGERKIIMKFSNSLSDEEMKWYMSLVDYPFLVIRAAGSLGVDLIAIRSDYAFPIEVKSSSQRKLRFSENSARAQEQASRLRQSSERAGIIALYAYRLKGYRGDPWRIFALPMENTEERKGYVKRLYSILPKIALTPHGNLVLNWDEGMPLSKFISYLNYGR